jgi:malonate decarboxylase alpha subunit
VQIELFARCFMDLTPHVALIAAMQADRDGNLYTGPNHRGHAYHRRGD